MSRKQKKMLARILVAVVLFGAAVCIPAQGLVRFVLFLTLTASLDGMCSGRRCAI